MTEQDDDDIDFRAELPDKEDRELVECCNYCGETWGVGVPLNEDRECPLHSELPEHRIYKYDAIDVVNPREWFDRVGVDVEEEVREP